MILSFAVYISSRNNNFSIFTQKYVYIMMNKKRAQIFLSSKRTQEYLLIFHQQIFMSWNSAYLINAPFRDMLRNIYKLLVHIMLETKSFSVLFFICL